MSHGLLGGLFEHRNNGAAPAVVDPHWPPRASPSRQWTAVSSTPWMRSHVTRCFATAS